MYSPIDWQFFPFTILNKCVVKIHVSVWTNIIVSLDLGVQWLTHSVGKHLTLRNCQSNCIILHSHQQFILHHTIQNFNLYLSSHLFTHISHSTQLLEVRVGRNQIKVSWVINMMGCWVYQKCKAWNTEIYLLVRAFPTLNNTGDSKKYFDFLFSILGA